jgi:subtilisin family serine protease
MRIGTKALLCLAAAAALTLTALASASAQKYFSRGSAPVATSTAPRGGGYRGPGWGAVAPGIIMAVPQYAPQGGRFIDDGSVDDGPPRNARRTTNRGPGGAPPANERRLVPDEVVIELRNTITPREINALQRRHRLTPLERQVSQLAGTTLYRWRIPDRRSVRIVVRELESDGAVASAQPNYRFALQQADAKAEGDPAQYELAKLHLPQAHTLARGDNVRVAVIDSGIDSQHPDLADAVVESFDALAPLKPSAASDPIKPHRHGTAIAGLIAAHGKLLGAAPAAKILAIRAFDPDGTGSSDGTTFAILKGLDWAAAHGARVINMSFAGPSDPAIHRSLGAAHKKGIVLVAAAGNAGAKSPPLYPAADPDVIAVSATDENDNLFEMSNRGSYIAVAAPGKNVFVAIPDSGYERSSGTSYSCAEVSGIVALMLERDSSLAPDRVRAILMATAHDLGPKGHDPMFGAGLADAFGAVNAENVANAKPAIERVGAGVR